MTIRSQFCSIIKPSGFKIENSQFHGITHERALAEGVSFQVAAQWLFTALASLPSSNSLSDLSSVIPSVALITHQWEFHHATIRHELDQLNQSILKNRETKRFWVNCPNRMDLQEEGAKWLGKSYVKLLELRDQMPGEHSPITHMTSDVSIDIQRRVLQHFTSPRR